MQSFSVFTKSFNLISYHSGFQVTAHLLHPALTQERNMTLTLMTQLLFPHHAHVTGQEGPKNNQWLLRVLVPPQERLLKSWARLMILCHQVIGQSLFHNFHCRLLKAQCRVSRIHEQLNVNCTKLLLLGRKEQQKKFRYCFKVFNNQAQIEIQRQQI